MKFWLTSLRLVHEAAAANLSWLPLHTGMRDMLDTERNDLMLGGAPTVPPDATESNEDSLFSGVGGAGGSEDSFRSCRFCTGPRCAGFGGTLGGVWGTRGKEVREGGQPGIKWDSQNPLYAFNDYRCRVFQID